MKWCIVLTALLGGVCPCVMAAPKDAPTTKPDAPASAPCTQAANPARVLATFDGTPITQGEIDRMIRPPTAEPAPEIPEDVMQQQRQQALTYVLRQKLYEAYAADHPGLVTAADIDAVVKQYEDRFAQSGRSLDDMLKQRGMTRDDFKKWATVNVVGQKFMEKGKDEKAIADFYEKNKASFDGTKVTAKHILILVDEYLGKPEDWEKAKAKLIEIKKDIANGKMTFDEAVEKYSEDPGKVRGPTLPPFQRYGMMVEPFAAAAFATKVGEISDPVKTNYGYHLIQVVSRDPGEPTTPEQAKETVGQILVGSAHETLAKETRDKHPIKVFLDYVKPPQRRPPAPSTRNAATRPTATRPAKRPPSVQDSPKPAENARPPEGVPTAPPQP